MRHAGCELLGPHAEVALGKCGLRLKHMGVHGFGTGLGCIAVAVAAIAAIAAVAAIAAIAAIAAVAAIAAICLLGAFNELQIGQHALVNGAQLIGGQILHGQFERRV